MNTITMQIAEMAKAGGNVLRCVLDPGGGAAVGIDCFKKSETGKFDLAYAEGECWDSLSIFYCGS